MRCIKCGCENPSYAVVCEQCGEFLPKEDLTGSARDEITLEPLGMPQDEGITDYPGTTAEESIPGFSGTTAEESGPNTSEKLDNSILDLLGEKKIICSYCWTKNNRTDTVCVQCGMPLEYVPYAEREGEFGKVPRRRKQVGPVVPAVANPIARPIPEGMVRCRNCWADNPKTAAHCESCGYELRPAQARAIVDEAYETLNKKKDEKIVCVNCGASVLWSSISCDYCGKHPRVVQRDDTYDDDGPSALEDIVNIIMKVRPSEPQGYRASDWVLHEAPEGRRWVNPSTARKVRCAKCLELNEPGSTECRFCGAKITLEAIAQSEGRKICTCGYKNLPKVTVCLMCGGLIRNEDAVEDTAGNAAEEAAEETE